MAGHIVALIKGKCAHQCAGYKQSQQFERARKCLKQKLKE